MMMNATATGSDSDNDNAPWRTEPDHLAWTDPATGYACMICRNPDLGCLCGYVDVPKDHARARGARPAGIDVHGGLTFVRNLPDGGRRFGFDCAHPRDYFPFVPDAFSALRAGTYRTFDYVKAEVESLARQLKEAAS